MTELALNHPVHTLDNRLLLPAGAIISDDTLSRLVSPDTNRTVGAHFRLLDRGSIKEDLPFFLSLYPHRVIFDDERDVHEVLNLMNQISVGMPVLQSLEFFKDYDYHTYRHTLVVSALSTLLAQDMLSRRHDRIHEAVTIPAHDLGKVCVPRHILGKTAPLTRSERSILEHHAMAGYVLLSYYLQDPHSLAARVARDHHERKDGSGYPRGIRLEDLMVELVVVSDVYDALISPRPYRPHCYDNRTALEEITAMAERGEISWDVVRALVARNRKSKPRFNECKVSTERRGSPPTENLYGVVVEDEN